jgi:hypothetical protein
MCSDEQGFEGGKPERSVPDAQEPVILYRRFLVASARRAGWAVLAGSSALSGQSGTAILVSVRLGDAGRRERDSNPRWG